MTMYYWDMEKHCSRCGGTGKVSRGMVVNGTCYKCAGDGNHRPSVFARTRGQKVVQFVLVSPEGYHLALNTNRAILEQLSAQHPDATIQEKL